MDHGSTTTTDAIPCRADTEMLAAGPHPLDHLADDSQVDNLELLSTLNLKVKYDKQNLFPAQDRADSSRIVQSTATPSRAHASSLHRHLHGIQNVGRGEYLVCLCLGVIEKRLETLGIHKNRSRLITWDGSMCMLE
jgi:hypothetical protein